MEVQVVSLADVKKSKVDIKSVIKNDKDLKDFFKLIQDWDLRKLAVETLSKKIQ
jgi:hypothetical protein